MAPPGPSSHATAVRKAPAYPANTNSRPTTQCRSHCGSASSRVQVSLVNPASRPSDTMTAAPMTTAVTAPKAICLGSTRGVSPASAKSPPGSLSRGRCSPRQGTRHAAEEGPGDRVEHEVVGGRDHHSGHHNRVASPQRAGQPRASASGQPKAGEDREGDMVTGHREDRVVIAQDNRLLEIEAPPGSATSNQPHHTATSAAPWEMPRTPGEHRSSARVLPPLPVACWVVMQVDQTRDCGSDSRAGRSYARCWR